jgi:hypothetical protein
VRTDRVRGIACAVLQSDDPGRLARRWGGILQRAPEQGEGGWRIALGNASLRFVAATDGRGEGLAGIEIEVADAQAITGAATACGFAAGSNGAVIGGIRFTWRTRP